MGSRGRSIRLRIYFLVAIPLIALVGLLAYIAGTLVNNAVNLDRAPSLINATGIPAARFGTYVQAERAAAVAYLFRPTAANLQAYQAAVASTNAHEPAFKAAMTSAGTVSSETSAEATAINAVDGDLGKLTLLRTGVQARALSALDALAAYSQGITDQQNLFLVEANSESGSGQLGQATGLIAIIQAREQLSQEDALLAGMLAGKRITAQDRLAFTNMAAARQADAANANFLLSPANRATYNAALAGSAAMQQDLTSTEQAVAAGTPATGLPVSQAGWQQLTGTLLQDEYNGGVAVADAILVADHQTSHAAWVKVAVTGGIVALGLLITILVSTLIGRGIIRGLRDLERSARTLAEEQLPDVVARLRRGEDVDVAAEAPPLRTGPGPAGPGPAGPGRVGRDEIGRVGLAFDQVRQTAIRAAVDEAKLRRGLNDVFRSLARRSQSLLHRQLILLDQMERRASDPEALDDLFRLDHLTTRMRRHAEGLVILAGAAPSRAWSSPVRMVDVMRGAIAEVEDYARVSVATRSQAALAGSAVADVIHLLAELVENATTLSPPYTSVRVSGDSVANGFAIEVEDRGLGMSPQRLAELNERLASPPEFNPSDSEQLGLFVVSQLANRHGIRVTLKASPYGGTSAIVLIPAHLVVTEEAFRAGLPGEQPAAIGTGRDSRPAANGNHLVPGQAGPRPVRSGGIRGLSELTGARPPEAPGIHISGALRRADADVPAASGSAPGDREDRGSDGLDRLDRLDRTDEPGGGPAKGAGAPGFDVFTPMRRGPEAADRPAPQDGGPAPDAPGPRAPAAAPEAGARAASYVNAPTYQDSPPYPGAGTGSYPHQPTPFPGWGAPPVGPPGPPTRMPPVAAPRTGTASAPPWELPGQTGSQSPAAGTGDEANGLPRRVRQASLAPQLRDNPPGRTSAAGGGFEASGPTPEELRKTMAALQRGWQEGRSQPMSTPAPGDPQAGPAGQGPQAGPGAPDGPGAPEGTTSERRRAAHEPPGGSDGT